eukprot:CAMPEP_0174293996 /NCGR_PEP_ID=MMETSP0809-20121228/40338_1 /TAXON_ID=73025 ORGANISM="Eutreptiella gymnastica-like, Strain CCMP1594" /NCGR_SAMPLE_ID=MMETSP0809 /ASSEMBLY_ACC=CAM_ASM_000658 /LENGTH=243 /DNA_ID=CAMNT_0015395145 /DNA_START=567 /DNA_END=1296 /DNA_ORIENTATION=-
MDELQGLSWLKSGQEGGGRRDAGSLIVSFSQKSTGHTKIRRHSRLTKSGSSNELICLFSHEPGTTWTSSPVHIACCGVCRGVFCAARPPDAAGDHDAPAHGYPLAHPLLHHVVFGAAPRRVLSLTPSPEISVAHHGRHPVLCGIAQDDLGLVLPPSDISPAARLIFSSAAPLAAHTRHYRQQGAAQQQRPQPVNNTTLIQQSCNSFGVSQNYPFESFFDVPLTVTLTPYRHAAGIQGEDIRIV